MINAIAAGIRENSDQTIVRTESVTDAGSMTELPNWSGIIRAPASPSKRATSEPEIALPNFCAIVPEEKMRPVEEVPNFSVA